MKIKKKREFSTLRILLSSIKSLSKLNKIFLIIITFVVWSFFMIYSGALLQRDSSMGGFRQSIHYAIRTNFNIPFNYIKGVLSYSKTKKIIIDIEHKEYQKIGYERYKAYQNGSITESEYFPAKLKYDNQSYEIGIRLAGKALDHINNDKWSLRIKIKDKKTVFGMRKFNLMHPKVRNGLYEWFNHKISKYEGLISLRTDFVNLKINGEDKGIYFLEESFDKYLIENNKFREGIIFKPLIPELQVYQKEKVLNSPIFKDQLTLLDQLFASFLKGELSANKLFDIEKTAKYFAITDLVNGFHQVARENMHFYFNPVTGKIEPIGREWGVKPYIDITEISGELINGQFQGDRGIINSKIFSDEIFLKKYFQELSRISKKEYLDDIFNIFDKEINQTMNKIYQSYPFFYFDKNYLYENQRFIQKKLNPNNPIKLYFSEDKNEKILFYVENQTNIPIQVNSLAIGDKNYSVDPIVLFPNIYMDNKNFFPLVVHKGQSIMLNDLLTNIKLYWGILGLNLNNLENVSPWPYKKKIIENTDFPRAEVNFENFDFINLDKKSKVINILSGKWMINETIVFPRGYIVKNEQNLELNLVEGACIISYSPISFSGTKNKPFLIHSNDNTGKGLIIIDAAKRSSLDGVNFRQLSNPSSFGWELTGAITFYQSDVDIKNCTFYKNFSEDYLNLIRSDFYIENSKFSEVFSDALDSDFCSGKIINCRFESCANDGIDISGSNIKLENIFFNKISDKALSIGEESKCSAYKLDINKVNIGIASKDRSELNANDVKIKNSRIGIVAYQKKPEFGPASVYLNNLIIKNTEEKYIVENNSNLRIDGKKLVGSRENIDKLLYPKI